MYIFPINGVFDNNGYDTLSLKNYKKLIFVAISRQGLFFIPILLFCSHFYGLLGIEVSQSIANIASFFAALPISMGILKYFKNNNDYKKNLAVQYVS